MLSQDINMVFLHELEDNHVIDSVKMKGRQNAGGRHLFEPEKAHSTLEFAIVVQNGGRGLLHLV